MIASGTWDIAMASRMTGLTQAAIRAKLIETAAATTGRQVVSGLASNALRHVVAAEAAAAMAAGGAATELGVAVAGAAGGGAAAAGGAGAAGAGGAAVAGAGAGGGGGSVVVAGGLGLTWALGGLLVLGALAYGGYKFYHRNDPPNTLAASAPPAATTAALPPALVDAPAAPPPQSCTKSSPFATVMRRGDAIRVEETRLTFNDPDTGVSNTIDWDVPPGSIRVGEPITMISRASHFPGGKPMEVQWEFGEGRGYVFGYGASTKTDTEQLRQEAAAGQTKTPLNYVGGPIRLKGGVNGAGDAFSFVMQWDYTCQ